MLIRIDRDEHGCSSAEEVAPSNSCFWHRRYRLNPEERKDNKLDPAEFLLGLYGLDEPEGFEDNRETFEDLLEKDLENGFVVRKVYMYDHGGITISMAPFRCPWDSGMVGIVWFDRDNLWAHLSEEERAALPEGKEFPEQYVELAEEMMRLWVKHFDAYLRGEEYFFTLQNGEEEDSCYGFICAEYPDTVEGIEASGMSDHWPSDWKERARVIYVPSNTVVLEGPPKDLYVTEGEIPDPEGDDLEGWFVMCNQEVLAWYPRERDAIDHLARVKKEECLR